MATEKSKSKRPAHNPRTQRRRRASSGRYWIYGRHAVDAAVANKKRHIHRLCSLDKTALKAATTPAEEVTKEELDALLPKDAVHQGVAALVDPLPEVDMATLQPTENGARMRIIVLDQVSDPRNIGAILRSASAFAVTAMIMPARHSPPETGALAKAASGALENIPIVRAGNLSRALETLKKWGYWCYGFDAGATTQLGEVEFAKNAAIILGAEGTGLRRLTAEHCDLVARLPMEPGSESINVSAAAAIILYAAYTSN
jgi:23S rRNA (guanosine2251-2'-O)-methyltransferase